VQAFRDHATIFLQPLIPLDDSQHLRFRRLRPRRRHPATRGVRNTPLLLNMCSWLQPLTSAIRLTNQYVNRVEVSLQLGILVIGVCEFVQNDIGAIEARLTAP